MASMKTEPCTYRGFRFPAEIISHAVWLYHCFSLCLREVETILAQRGIVVSYESIRAWGLRFGRAFANTLKRRRPRPGDDLVARIGAPGVGGPLTLTRPASGHPKTHYVTETVELGAAVLLQVARPPVAWRRCGGSS